MTIGNALTFIRTGQKDGDLRRRLVKAKGKEELKRMLARQNLDFTQAEFEEAYSLSLFKCQRPGDAESLKTFRLWWTLLLRSTERAPANAERP